MEYTITEIIPPDGYIGESAGKKITPAPFSENNVVTFTNRLGSVTFTKNYEGADGLPVDGGAVFRIYRESDGTPGFTGADENFTVKDDINGVESSGGDRDDANNATGTIKVTDLKTGSYMVKEIQAPTGWVLDPDEVTFSIPGAGGTADVVLADPTFTDPRATYPLTVRKVAEADNSVLIDGAVFDLYKETNGTAGLQLGGGHQGRQLHHRRGRR